MNTDKLKKETRNLELGVEILFNKPVDGYIYNSVKLPKEKIEKWVETLESGRFPQGKRKLCMDGEYCCLGVLAKIENKLERAERGRFVFNGSDSFLFEHEEISERGYLPFWANFKVEGAFFKANSLVDLNDKGATFQQIAWIIKTLFL